MPGDLTAVISLFSENTWLLFSLFCRCISAIGFEEREREKPLTAALTDAGFIVG